jgi:D-amino-acid dehydrogenase
VGTEQHVVVIGGGVIGLSSAYHLARAGIRVTLIERDRCGRGASFGNAGWIVPSLVTPFNAPGAVPQSLRAMLNPHSPIALRQVPTWALIRWGLEFFRASGADRSRASLRALAVMAASAADDVTALADRLGFEVHRTGLLVPFRSPVALDAYRAAHSEVESLGYQGRIEILDADAVRDREPSLADDVIGGLHLLDEVSIRPDAMTAALARAVTATGGELAEHETVRDVTPASSGQWRVLTEARTLIVDAVVVAAGERTAALLGRHVRLQSGRGCSVTLPPGLVELRQPLKIAEHRVACTPFAGGEVRISGTFDLVRPGAGTAPGRMRGVLNAASTHLPALRDLAVSDVDVWSGARPCTADSVPVVGPVGRVPGLFVATGHGTLGMTLAPATGQAIARLVSETVTTGRPK